MNKELLKNLKIIEDREAAEKRKSLPPTVVSSNDIDDDYNYSRDTLKELINLGKDHIKGLGEVCKQTEHPRAYEVLLKGMKDIADTTDKLMALQKAKKDVKDKKTDEEEARVNKHVFVGSVTELQKMLVKAGKDEKVIDVIPPDIE